MNTMIRTGNAPRTLTSTPAYADQILTRGFTEIDINPSVLAEHIEPIKDGMRRITSDNELGALFPQQVVAVDEVGWDQEAGLYRRTGGETTSKLEEKFFFHYAPEGKWAEDERIRQFVEFLTSCEMINKTAARIVLAVAGEIDAMHAMRNANLSAIRPTMESAFLVTRILRYLEHNGGNADAYTHLDRSAFTVH